MSFLCFSLLSVLCCSKTLAHPAPRTIVESVNDQENIPVNPAGKALISEYNSTSDSAKPNAMKGKRLNAGSISGAPAKKSKAVKSLPKSKVVPLQKGQKKLSAFFQS